MKASTSRLLSLALMMIAGLSSAAEIDPYAPVAEPQVQPIGRGAEHLVSYKYGSGIYGRRVVGTLGSAPFEILRGGINTDQSRHVSTQKRDASVSVVAAERRTTTPIGSVGALQTYDIEVVSLDVSQSIVARRQLNISAGVSTRVSRTELALASNPNSSSCCVALAWSDVSNRTIEIERLFTNLVSSDTRLRTSGGANVLRHPALAFMPATGGFLLVYETRADIRARRIPASGTTLGPELVVATKLRAARDDDQIDGKPALVFSPALNAFLVSWRDTASDGSRLVRATTLSSFGGSPSTVFTVWQTCTPGSFLCFFQPVATGAPRAVATDDGFALVFQARPWGADRHDIVSYRLTMPTRFSQAMSWRLLPPASTEYRHSPALATTMSGTELLAVFVDNSRLIAERYGP